MLTATPHANDTNATNATEMTFTPMLTPAPTPEIGLCNNGGSRGWLEKVTDGFHPILPFGPSASPYPPAAMQYSLLY